VARSKYSLRFTIDDSLEDALDLAIKRTKERTGGFPVVFSLHPSTFKRYEIGVYKNIIIIKDKNVMPDHVYVPVEGVHK